MRVIFLKFAIRLLFICGTIILCFSLWLHLPSTTSLNKTISKDSPKTQEEEPNDKPEEEAKQMVHMERSDGSSLDIELETYLQGVVGSEMPASFSLEALKAQAVAARTFVCKREYQVDDTTASQVYHDEQQLQTIWDENYETYHAKIKQAITETENEIMTYEGEVITAAFFSSSNGETNNSEDYWKEALPYLRSVDSPWDVKQENNTQSVSFSPEEFAQSLGFAQPVSSIQTPIRYANGYVESVTMDGIVFTGRELREKLRLRSSAFEISVDDTITITTHGYGHGIGLSQIGAEGMAQEGSSYKDILQHYYTGVEIMKLNV